MAKHFKQNPNLKESGQKLIATLEIVALLAGAAYGTFKLTSKDDQKNDSKDESHIEYVTSDDIDVESIINSIESNYQIYASDGLLNTNGLIFKYLREKISDDSLSNQEKFIIIRDLLADDESLVVELYNYILDYYSNAKEIDSTGLEINNSNLSMITNDQELMEYVSRYAQMYGVPKECVIGILATSIGENQRFENNFNMSTYWNNLSATRSARNTVTSNDDRLNDYQRPQTKEEYVRYVCMVLANSLKEGNRNLETALEFYYLGVDNMKKLESSAPERTQAKEFSNEVILYVMAYEKDDIVTIEVYYPSMQGMTKYNLSYISSDFKDYLISTTTAISNQIYINVPNLSNSKTY